jgi:histidine triad (HIT) family protein
MENCVFCEIVKGTLPASMVSSDEKVLAFLDIQPVNPGHVLIIPKMHSARLLDLDEETGAHMFKIAMRVSRALRQSGVKCEGINLHLADGEAAFQEVLHVHLHVIPRFRGDGFGLKFGPAYNLRPDRRELDKIGRRILTAMPSE